VGLCVKALRVAIFGAGHMGRSHAHKVAALARRDAGLELAMIMDIDLERAQKLGAEVGAGATADAGEALRAGDAAIVAVPTGAHFRLVTAALDAGLDVLVEKPMAATLDEAEAILELASRRARILQVGHLEWFNPVLREMRGRIAEPRFIEAHRMGPFSERGTDVDVVRDLMIHDLDILQQILGEEPDLIESIGVPVVTDKADIANARIGFPSGCIANLTASRVSPKAVRKIRFFQRDGYLSIDLLAHAAVHFHRFPVVDGKPPQFATEQRAFDPEDSLLAQLEGFVSSVRTRNPPAVSGREGLRALRSALRVVEAMARFGDPD
jgi:predicted dehydrogenase